jgi:hypothetical protein
MFTAELFVIVRVENRPGAAASCNLSFLEEFPHKARPGKRKLVRLHLNP